MKHKDAKGFTLIELLVVIVILGILSTISVGTFRSYFAKARDAERISAVSTVAELIRADSGARGDCGLYNYTLTSAAAASETYVDSGEECDKAAYLEDLLEDNDYKLPEVKSDLPYYYGFKLGEQEGRNEFFVAVGTEEDAPQNAMNISANPEIPVYVFASGTSQGVADLNSEPGIQGGGLSADECLMSDGGMVCGSDWLLYTYYEDGTGETWGFVPAGSTPCIPGTPGCNPQIIITPPRGAL